VPLSGYGFHHQWCWCRDHGPAFLINPEAGSKSYCWLGHNAGRQISTFWSWWCDPFAHR
jgi:hypothetical protein